MRKYKDFLLLIIFAMGSQIIIYFLINILINDFNMLTSIIEVPLIKPFVYFYNSWYPFIFIVSFIIYKYNHKVFYLMISVMLLTAILAQITFIVYPSIIERPTIEVTNFTDALLDLTYKCDTPAVNCLPSMHCIYCFIIIYFIMGCKTINIKKRIAVVTYSFIIILSTLFTKQHIIEDAILAFIYVLPTIYIVNYNKYKIIGFTSSLFKKN